MQAGEGDLADGVQPLQIGTGSAIGHDSAADVVRRRYHWDRLLGHVEAVFQTFGVNVGKVRADEIGWFVADVQIYAFRAQPFHLMVDGSGYDIARGQFQPGVEVLHEATAIGQQ